MQKVAPEKQRFIRPADQPEDRWAHVERPAELTYFHRLLHHRGPQHHHGNLVGRNRDAQRSINPGPVVGYDYENRVGPKGFLFREAKEFPERKIGILHGILAPLLIWVLRNTARRIRIRFVIGNRENGREEGLVLFGEVAQLLDGPVKNVFISHTPNGGEGWLLEVLLFDESIEAVARREGAHPVKKAAPAVDE